MRSIMVTEFGEPEVLEVQEVLQPQPQPHEVLLRVVSTSVNFADIKARQGRYHGTSHPPFIPGLDAAGIVVALGSEVQGIRVGTPVLAFTNNGSYAEYATASSSLVFPLPEGVNWDMAAALPVVAFTAYKLLHDVGRIVPGERILIHAAAGGVGTTAIQLARLLGASEIYGTVSHDGKKSAAVKVGADLVINYTQEDFVKEIQERTNGRGVDLILDAVGGPIAERSMEILAPFGRMVHFGSASGQGANISLGDLHASCRSVLGFSLGTTRVTRPESLESTAKAVLHYVSAGQLTIQIGRKYLLEEAAAAHRWIESRSSTGKTLLEVGPKPS